MTHRPDTPLAQWEVRIWIFGSVLAVTIAGMIMMLYRAGAGPFVIGLLSGASMFAATALGAFVSRRAHDHQVRLQDEAESVRGRFDQWLDWLSRGDASRSEASGSEPSRSDPKRREERSVALRQLELPLTPRSLAEFAMISDRIRAATLQLQHERAEANAVLSNLDGGVIALDPASRITLINAAARKFFQVDRPCVGQPLLQAIRQPEIIESVQRVFRDRSSRDVHVEIRTDDGLRRSLRVRCSSLRYGDVAGVLITAHDESEAKHSEEVRREFVANVSHELKTPLAAIKGYAETVELALGDDPEAAKHFVSQIHDQCKRLERLIADMMTLARAQAGAQHLRPTTVDLDEVIAESIATYAPVAAARRIALTHRHDGDLPSVVFADREATLTITNNVIGNAIRYTPEGGAVVASSRTEGGFGVLSVKDNGIGIPENEQKRIFERFYRVDRSRKHATSGTGLGLSIVKNLTQAQAGEVKLRSRQGEGSTFEIYLPVPAESKPDPETRPTETLFG